MRQALEAVHRGWGVSVVIGVAEAGKEYLHARVQLRNRPGWKGTAFARARPYRRPKIFDCT